MLPLHFFVTHECFFYEKQILCLSTSKIQLPYRKAENRRGFYARVCVLVCVCACVCVCVCVCVSVCGMINGARCYNCIWDTTTDNTGH